MLNYEYEFELDKYIKQFIRQKQTTEEDLFKFFKETFAHPDKEKEFTHKIAKNLIKITYSFYSTLSNRKKIHFLKAISKLFYVALSIAYWDYNLSREDADWWWQGNPHLFVSISNLIEPLEAIRREMGKVNKRYLRKRILLVEGQSEEQFFRVIQDTGHLLFDFDLFCYRGKGEIQNLIHLINEKSRQGVGVFLSYDKDGQNGNFLREIKKKCKIYKTLGFKIDFESSFPPLILQQALKLYFRNYLNRELDIETSSIRRLLRKKMPFLKVFKYQYREDIKKRKLAFILGKLIARELEFHGQEIVYDKRRSKKYQAEIYSFLRDLSKYY